MKKILFLCVAIIYFTFSASAQKNNYSIPWRASLHRADSIDIVFNFIIMQVNKKPAMYLINAAERMRVDSISFVGDSVFIKMPVFESGFRAKVTKGKWEGVWRKASSAGFVEMPFTAAANVSRFNATSGNAKFNVSGRWSANFETDKTKADAAVAEFVQKGNKITGTFLTPTGDYRYLEGIVTGNKLKMSGFDGSHAFLFTGEIANNKNIKNGTFFSGAKYKEGFLAVKDPKAKVSTDVAAMYLRPGEERLDFRFPGMDSNLVSISDDRFKNKVVVLQILGSWCPNCMDETAFLSDYYNKNKSRGVEMAALAYEYSTDFNRSVTSLKKFQQRFNIQYPILITGVKVSDSLRTEKTLPQVTPIKVFPSTIFIDKKGKVRKFDTGFFGPGTGAHYEEYKREFYKTMNELLSE
ncbi:hypothetical protein BH09BAC2_BH09BAC2_13870 [soil metagenome]